MTNGTQGLPHLKPKQVKGGMRTWSLQRRPEGTSLFNPANEDREESAVCQLGWGRERTKHCREAELFKLKDSVGMRTNEYKLAVNKSKLEISC